jgi:hypothetical protein
MATTLALATAAYAQGGGASTTGTIQGRVTDASGAVLPGVTVTINSPSLIGGPQSQVTNEQGNYRFPAVAPGTYAVQFELGGFSGVKREGILITLGFTANVNVELAVATLQETVTVTGESPIIDTSATRVQQNFKLEELNSLPNARDMWALLAVTPGVAMSRIDVGGNRAGTQTGYTAYGFGGPDQQVRVLVEGINTTEGTGGAGFYFDYGSFEEVFLGTAGQGAEMPHPGVQSQLLGKSGGNQFQGAVYIDWYNGGLQSSNIPDEFTAPGAFSGNPIREGSNEIKKYYDFNLNAGGAIKQDKLWWYASYRDQFNSVEQVNLLDGTAFDTELWNLSGKGTYLINQNHKLIGYYQWGQKIQPYRLWSGSYTYASSDFTQKQDSGSWVYKGEWNGTISNRLYVEARYGEFGYYFPLIGYTDQPFQRDAGTLVSEGGDRRWQQDRQRKQLTGAATYFKDGWAGNHSFKFGGEMNIETQWNGFEVIRAGNIEHVFNNGVSNQVILGFPTASCEVGSLSARDCLLSIAKLDHHNLFLNDTWNMGRMTLNLGIRYDHYKSHVPEQEGLAATTGGIALAATTFPAQTFFTWDSVVPRAGVTYDLRGDGRSVLKFNYGYFKHNPGPTAAANGNPNQAQKDRTYNWTDLNGDRLFQNGEQGTLLSDRTGPGGVQIDPNIEQPYTHEVAAFYEQQISEVIGVRVGYVYKTQDDLFITYQPFRGIDAHTVPFSFLDRGADGVLNTSDDVSRNYLGIPNSLISSGGAPATNIVQNVPAIGRYKTFELSATKRMSNRWSAGAGYGFTWTEEHNSGYNGNVNVFGSATRLYPNSPNDTALHDFTGWGFRVFGAIEAAYGIRLSPIFRHQSGQPYGRTLVVSAPASCACTYTGTVLVEPLGTRRMNNFNILDVKVEKSFALARSMRLRGFLDFFNIFNSHSSEVISYATGTGFERPTNIIAPFTMRIGARFEW